MWTANMKASFGSPSQGMDERHSSAICWNFCFTTSGLVEGLYLESMKFSYFTFHGWLCAIAASFFSVVGLMYYSRIYHAIIILRRTFNYTYNLITPNEHNTCVHKMRICYHQCREWWILNNWIKKVFISNCNSVESVGAFEQSWCAGTFVSVLGHLGQSEVSEVKKSRRSYLENEVELGRTECRFGIARHLRARKESVIF